MSKKTDADKDQIEKFLSDFRERMRWIYPPIIYLDQRDKNNVQQLSALDITGNKRDEIIKGLTYLDYMEARMRTI